MFFPSSYLTAAISEKIYTVFQQNQAETISDLQFSGGEGKTAMRSQRFSENFGYSGYSGKSAEEKLKYGIS